MTAPDVVPLALTSSDLVQLALGLVGSGGLGLLTKQIVDAIRARGAEPPEPLPAPAAAAVVAETNDGNAALVRALASLSEQFERLEGDVARCVVQDCPVRRQHFRPKGGDS